jgi:hypothetical protein
MKRFIKSLREPLFFDPGVRVHNDDALALFAEAGAVVQHAAECLSGVVIKRLRYPTN